MADGVTTQDATLATIPTATKIATDDAGSPGHVQLVKLAVPTDGSATTWGDAGDGLPVEITNASIAVTGSISAGGDPHVATVTSSGLTTATTLYTAGDELGVLLELTSMAATSGAGGTLTSAVLLCDTPAVISGVRCLFFTGSVTPAGNNSQLSISDADMLKFEGDVVFMPPFNAALNVASTMTNINLDYVCDATSLYVLMQTLTATTVHFAAADDLHLRVHTVRT